MRTPRPEKTRAVSTLIGNGWLREGIRSPWPNAWNDIRSRSAMRKCMFFPVPDSVRGRVFGLFITIGGLLGNLSHYLMGKWVVSFGARANEVPAYYSLYNWLALFLLASLIGLPCLRALRKREQLAAAHSALRLPRSALP
jgi:MFS family permease